MRVNLGCGEFYAEGWVNVDFGSPHRHDVTADLREPLPFEGVTHAYLGHVLEHLALDEARDLLARLRAVTAPGGRVMVVGPDVHRAEAMRARGLVDDEWLGLIRDGGHRWPGDAHLWLCHGAAVVDLLTESGWLDVAEADIDTVEGWPVTSTVGWQCAVLAHA